ncbi:Transcriptional regulatory protein moc3 [Diaporthe amygdali]|uniref:Transcriptional regulatory protein moc3 n=1 Tax=Phomopsis amygdali TaxID=1214568 RepID=UPI0022FE6E83|nr:Transcriptional regulatory protein moc3 [Diaporthe amygdali]KAJ0118260.1 Transcriptional regulatory protein moc3 [Diaporthe amygdali]
MARKGSTKVRTGCFTCKARKVKCDEAKPHCRRCTSTCRKCEGYPAHPTGQAAYSWADLLSAQNVAPTVVRRNPSMVFTSNDMEARALEFFRLQVAPVLSKHSSKKFWNILVSQVGQQEPAVHHALVCIGSMYEGLNDTSHDLLALSRERFAITQYNLALSKLISSANDKNTTLLVCLLFICIETMRGDKDMAIEHCRHGITICNSTPQGLLGWAKQELQPIFLRLATFPYFFGVEAADFPEPVGLVSDPIALDVTSKEMETSWNWLVNRTVRLIRLGLSYRQGPLRHLSTPSHLYEEQRDIFDVLVVWRNHYRDIRLKGSLSLDDFPSHLSDEMKCIVGKIWVSCCLSGDETAYDEHNQDFEELIHLAGQFAELKLGESGPKPKFIFEMGFMPYLYFVVLNCRRLDLRLAALRYMPLLGYERENLFKAKMLYYVGMRCVEIEHGISLDPARPEFPNDIEAQLPADQFRIRSADITDEVEFRLDENGREVEYKKVFFWIKPDAITPGFTEWVKIGSFPSVPPRTEATTPTSSAAMATE